VIQPIEGVTRTESERTKARPERSGPPRSVFCSLHLAGDRQLVPQSATFRRASRDNEAIELIVCQGECMRNHSEFLSLFAAVGLGASWFASAQTIEPFAGNGQGTPSNASGPALTTPIANLQDVAVAPNGVVYLVDASRVRVIGTDGFLVTVPGTGPRFGPGANSANIQAADIAIDGAGRVFVTDGTRFRVLEMSPSFAFTTIAGTGVAGFLGDGGPATAAQLSGAVGIDFDSTGNLYIAEANRVRRISPAGIISTIASSTFGGPPGQFVMTNMAVSGNGAVYTSINNGTANLWKSTTEGEFERVNPSSSIVQRCIAGPVTTQAVFGPPRSGRDGLVYIANDTCVSRLTPGGSLVNIAGTPQPGFAGELGPLADALFQGINSLAFDTSGRLYIGDARNFRIRRVTGLPVFTNSPPVAAAGADQIAVQGDLVGVVGSSSSDPEGTPLQYAWRFSTQPAGSAATLSNATTASAQFTADVAGDYTLTLEVSDGELSATDDVNIHVQSRAEFALEALNSATQALALTPDSTLDAPGHRQALQNFLSQAGNAVVSGNWRQVRHKVEAAIGRVDGCYLRGVPDGNGGGSDWIVECGYQTDPYFWLSTLLNRLT